MQNQRDMSILFQKKTKIEKDKVDKPQTDFWLADCYILETLNFVLGGIVVIYEGIYHSKRKKYFRLFTDYDEMVNIIASEIMILFNSTSISVSEAIKEVNIVNGNIIIPNQNDNTEIKLKLCNEFQTLQLFERIKSDLNLKLVEDEKFVKVRK